MSDLREQIRPYLRDDIDSVEITIPQGLVRKLMEVNMLQTARIEELEAVLRIWINEYGAVSSNIATEGYLQAKEVLKGDT